jgi:hypothetical protein
MNIPNPNIAARFIVQVPHVKEVTLAAEADWAYWRDRLRGEALFPFRQDNKAHLMISATELHSMGRRTNELTIGLIVCERPSADSPDALFLVHAFNSSRLFAWVERTFFSTPYYRGRLQVDAQLPVKIRLEDRAGLILQAHMTAAPKPATTSDELWQGKIYLPRRQAKTQYFVAKLGGLTDIYSFAPADTFQMNTRPEHPAFQWLRESDLACRAWRIRTDATHARSKTYARASAG